MTKIFNESFQDDDFVDPEASDIIVSDFFNTYKLTPKTLNRKYNQVSSLETDIDELRVSIDDRIGYLITSKSETCGLYKIDIRKALSKYKKVIKLDGDSLSVFSMDEKSGIHIDFFEEYERDILFLKYEISVWG